MSEVLARHPDLPRRTAQRLLSGWVEQGLLERHGLGPATRYVAAQPEPPSYLPDRAGTFPEEIPLSPDSRDVLAYVSRSLQGRHPIGYDDDFLDRYDPAKPYLSATLRRQLRQMGELGEDQLPAGTYGREVLDRLLIDLSWSSSRLEGNTYSRLDTVALIQHGELADGKSTVEAQMILNHKSAIEFLVDGASEARLDAHTVLGLHGMLAERLLPNVSDEGRLRKHAVMIGQSVYRPLSLPQRIDEEFRRLLGKVQGIEDPFEQAFFLLVHLPYLQPFADVNKRVSRVVANLPLIRANLCPLTFVGVPELAYAKGILGVYEMTRVELLRDVFMSARQITVRVHPDDHALVAQGAAEVLAERGARLLSDHSIARGGCLVESDIGVIDASIAERWKRAVASLGCEESWGNDDPSSDEYLGRSPEGTRAGLGAARRSTRPGDNE